MYFKQIGNMCFWIDWHENCYSRLLLLIYNKSEAFALRKTFCATQSIKMTKFDKKNFASYFGADFSPEIHIN